MRRRNQAAPLPVGFGEHPPLPDQRVPLTSFAAQGGLSFEEVVAALQAGSCCIRIKVTRQGEQLPRRGRATEFDERGGIVRVEPFNDTRHGVAFLISRVDGVLLGEFAD